MDILPLFMRGVHLAVVAGGPGEVTVGDSKPDMETVLLGENGEERDVLAVDALENAGPETFRGIIVFEPVDDLLRCAVIVRPRLQNARVSLNHGYAGGEGGFGFWVVCGGDEVVGEGEAVPACEGSRCWWAPVY